MSRTSSGSSSGGGAAPPADIIDLDRFMRSARPSHQPLRSQLVVDAGGLRAHPPASTSSSSAERLTARPAPRSAPRSAARAVPRDKRQSHDSGLSDGSYGRRRQRQHRRVSCETPARPKEPATSATSLRAFRTVCERALRDQQQQIARVAQLCERLTDQRPAPPSDTSDISSSSRSTRDQRRKDKHRTEECKTYKIIMNKLDELNRLFAARTRSPPARPHARPPPRTRRAESTSESVSVSDKLVATDATSPKANCVSPTTTGDRARRMAVLRAVTAGPALDIAPRRPYQPNQPNVLTESVVKCDSTAGSGTSGCDPQSGFDLDNPVHLYAQAKRLQALHASTSQRRARSDAAGSPRAASLCALCRGYLRALRDYLAAQLCYPAQPCAS